MSSTLEKTPVSTSPQPIRIEVKELKKALRKELKENHSDISKKRLEELEKTIDAELKKSEKDAIVEFSADEWNKLIGREGLPPIEEVRPILEKRLEERKEITQEAKDAKKGIVATMKEKAEEAKTKAGDMLEKGKDLVEGKVKGLKDAVMGKMSPWEVAKFGFNGLMFGLSVWFYGSLAKMGFKWAKEKLSNKKKEEAEKLIAIAKEKGLPVPPELAKVVSGNADEPTEKEKNEKSDEKKEKEGEKSALEKFAPIGILSGLGVGMFAFAKKSLPESMTKNLSPEDGKGILKMATKSGRGLKLFGIAGVTLLGAGLLYNYLETDAGKREIAAFPSDAEGKKKWWTNILEKAGVGIHEGANELWSLVNGDNLDEYLTKRENERQQEGYCNLEDHPLVAEAGKKLRAWSDSLTAFAIEHAAGLTTALIAANILSKGAVIDTGLKGMELVMDILKKGAGTAVSHPILLALSVVIGVNGGEAMRHIQVKKDMTSEDFGEMIGDILTLKDFRDYIGSKFPDSVDNKYLTMAGQEFTKLSGTIVAWRNDFEKNLDQSMIKALEGLEVTHEEKICKINHVGFEAFLLRIKNIAEEKNNVIKPSYQKLLGTDGKGGILGECLKKIDNKKLLTEGDIRLLLEATNETDIYIFPAGGVKEGTTIQWCLREEDGQLSLPRNLCVNPTLSFDDQYEEAKDFVANPFEGGMVNTSLKFLDKVGEGGRDLIGELGGAIKDGKGEVLQWGTKTIFYDYVYKKYIKLPFDLFATALPAGWGGLTMQEFLVEQGQTIVPMIVIGTAGTMASAVLNRGKGFSFGKVLCETLGAPISGAIKSGKIATTIYHRAMNGDLKGMIMDPLVIIKEGLIGKIERGTGGLLQIGNTAFARDGINMKERGELREIRERTKKYKILIDRGIPHDRDDMKKLREKIQKSISSLAKNTRENIFGDKDLFVSHIDESDMKKIYEDVEIASRNLDDTLRKHLAEHPEILDQGRDPNNAAEIPKTKAELETMREKCERKIGELETEKQRTIDQNRMTPEKIREYNKRTQQLQKAMGSINEHINIRENGIHGEHAPETGKEKWTRRGKGLLGLAVLVGAMIGIQKLRSDEPGMKIPELDALDEDRDYYGFRRDEDIPEEEKNEKKNKDKPVEEKKTASIKDAPEYIRPFLTRMSEIQGMYGTEFDFICDPKALKDSEIDVIKGKVNSLISIHGEMLSQAKNVIKENKEEIKRFFRESNEKHINVKKGDLNAFMGLAEKDNGEITFDYMDEDDFSDTIWEMADFERDNADNLIAGTYNNWDKAGYMALRAAPLSSEYYDGRDMVRNFSRGKIGDGFASMGWLVGGALCDVGMFFTLGGTEAAKVAAVGGRTAVTWGRMSKILEVVKSLRIPLKAGEGAGLFSKSMAFSMTHSGKLMLGGMGADMGHQAVTLPRSESVGIDSL